MAKLNLSIAVGDYDRMRPLIDGAVQMDGVAPVFMTLAPEEIFFRAFRHAEFDICELSLSSFIIKTARGDNTRRLSKPTRSEGRRHRSTVRARWRSRRAAS